MKTLITLLVLIVATATATRAQQISIGTDHAAVGASLTSVFTQIQYKQSVMSFLTFSAGIKAHVSNHEKDGIVRNGNTIRTTGSSYNDARFDLSPSVMLGVEIPVKDFSIGIYSGYETDVINYGHRLVPVSIQLSF